jgi:hypothetical protein
MSLRPSPPRLKLARNQNLLQSLLAPKLLTLLKLLLSKRIISTARETTLRRGFS